METKLRQHSTSFPEDTPIGSYGVVDLFCGVGGFSLGAARAGFNLLAAVDNNARVAEAFSTNFPECTLVQEDIAKMTGAQLQALSTIGNKEIHGLIGGPPCQGFSSIGHRKASDSRNELFGHFFRLVSEIRPWFFIAENVKGILDPQYARFRLEIFQELTGYSILEPLILKSSDFGAPTNRARVLFVGYRPEKLPGITARDFKPMEGAEIVTVGTALQGLPRRINPSWQTEDKGWRKLSGRSCGWFWERVFGNIPPGVGSLEAIHRLDKANEVSACLGTRHTEPVTKRFSTLREGEADGPSRAIRLHRKGHCPTIRAGTGPERGSYQAVRPIHPTQTRVITPREAARLQGFPDWFQFDSTKWHSFRMIGNSVSPILAEGIMRAVYEHLCAKESTHAESAP